MLLNKFLKINIKIVLLIFLLLMFSTIAFAQICEVNNVKQSLRKTLYLYFIEPQLNPLTLDEVKDLLIFYLGISEGEVTADCSLTGTSSNKKISDLVNLGENAADLIPTCADGTKYGECSTFKPKYCYAGSLLNRCNYCLCPSASSCTTSGKCEALTKNISCSSNLDCGTSQFVGDYYCANNWITRDYINYTCENPGIANSNCISSTSFIKLNYCDPALNQICVEGNANCQVNDTNVTSKPDLIVEDITFTPANPTTADYTKVGVIIKNIGTVTAYNFSLGLNYHQGQSFSFGTPGGLVPGVSYEPGYLENFWPAGTNTFTATVDEFNQISELNENNNVLTKRLIVTNLTNQSNATTQLEPDLTVTSIQYTPSTPSSYLLTTIQAYFKNIGDATAENFVLRVDGTGETWNLTKSSLAAGSTHVFGPAYYFPSGTHTITATADAFNDVAESNEDNNAFSISLTITSTTTNQTNDTSITVQRVIPGQDDYNILVSDSEGIKELSLRKSDGKPWIYSSPGCVSQFQTSSAWTLSPTDFPLTAYVMDCQNSVTYKLKAQMPP